MRPRVLVVDDHLDLAETLADGLVEHGYDAVACASSVDAARRLETEPFDALVTDLRMPKVDGLGLLAHSRAAAPTRPVLVMTAYAAIETAVDAIRQGAYHYLTKPFTAAELALFLRRALDDASLRDEAKRLRAAVRDELSLGNLVAASPAMRQVFEVAGRVANTAAHVLLVGETGTGKTAIANAIHATSARAERPFIAINCAALPETLLESELFGHAKGAFTGATAARAGIFAEADGGTLLLDEIGEMSPGLQSKLLQVLETGGVRAVGAAKERTVDVRVMAATHRDLRDRVRAGSFREDLYYRLVVVVIEIPALRHRREDIPILVERMLSRARTKHPHSPVERFSREALGKLLDHVWPGNVRELAHTIERVVVLGRDVEASVADLPSSLHASLPAAMPSVLEGGVLRIREVQRRYAAWALERFAGQRSRTAEALGIDAKTLAKWLNGELDPPH
jgi:two-component system, NtrC family, response regulator HydG